ncbi:MAG: hypothetical protein JO108_09080 [Acidobacteriaceae bacterium]|nr:hypothetical protein [Acidobacteriaceae bacterium]
MRNICFIPLLFLAHAAFGGAADRITPSHSQDIWDRAAGFSGGHVYSITQTGDGYLWIGTSKGLVRYDGLNFVSIRDIDPSVETNLAVVGLVTDSSDQLWLTDDHSRLFRYSAGRLVGPLLDSGRHLHRAGPVSISRNGSLLFASETQGLVEYEHGTARVLLDPSSIPSSPTAVAEATDGSFWIGTRDHGVVHLMVARGTAEVQHIADLPDAKINCLLPIAGATLLLGTDKGLLSIHDGRLIQETDRELGNIGILSLASDRDGVVWIGTDGRLFKADAKEIDAEGRIHSMERSAVRFPVSSLFEDRAGDLWIGGPDIIERYRTNGFATYSRSAGLPCSHCGSIYVDDHASLWFAPSDGGFFRLAHGSIEPINVAGLMHDNVYSIAGAPGEVWASRRNGGVTRLRVEDGGLRATTYTRRDGLPENAVSSIYRATNGAVWAGTLNKGLGRFKAGNWHTFTTQDGLPSNTISVITGNAAGEVFVGTPDGLAQLKNNHWATYFVRDGLPPGPIESLFLDDSGTLWIGTSKGISFLQSGTVRVPTSAPEPLFGEILGIAESNGWLWITTGTHVLRVRSSALRNNSFQAGDYREFGETNGLPSAEGVKRSRSVVEDSRGQIWFSLSQGISVLDPSAFARPAFPVTIRMDGMVVDGKLIAPGDHIRVPSGRRRLTFRYAGVNASNPESVRYRYRLDDVDSDWSKPTASREVDYTNVSPGRLQFEVMARDPDGRWSGHEAAMSFEVEPAYWQARWFQLGSAAAIMLLAWGLYRLRFRQMTAKMDLRYTERLAERTRIARDLHDTLLQSLQGLSMKLYGLTFIIRDRPAEAQKTLETIIEQAGQAITEGRKAVQGLRSSAVIGNDLAQAITTLGGQLVAHLSGRNSPDFRVLVEGKPSDLAPLVRDEVYRIACEALRNAFVHARARQIEVEIQYGARQLRLRVQDDGRGVDTRILREGGLAGHHGLPGMQERAKLIGGKLAVRSRLDAGTEIELTVPASIAYTRSLVARPSVSGRQALDDGPLLDPDSHR